MSIELPPQDLEAEEIVALGRFSSIDEVISEGIHRLLITEQLRAKVQVGIDQTDRGKLIDHNTV